MKKIIFVLSCLFYLNGWAQESSSPASELSLSLEEAVALGLENNYNSRIAKKEIAKSLKQKWEIIAQGLPQIGGEVFYTYNLIQPVTLLPGAIAGGEPGTFVPVTFGTKQSFTATATYNQLIFDGSYIVGIQSAKTLLEIAENQKVKTDQEVVRAITDAYGNVLLARENAVIARKNVTSIEKNLKDTQAIYESGFAELEDAEQLEITLLNLQSVLNNALRLEDIAYDMLKVSMGVPVDRDVYASENLSDLSLENYELVLMAEDFDVEENIDYRIVRDQANLAEVQVKLEKSKALPSLSAFINYGVQGNNDQFTFFDREQEYFDQSILGLTLNVPIFSSGLRSARTAQKQIELDQALIELESTENELKLQLERAKSEYVFAVENYENKQKALELAERIENKNQIKFFEGLASSFELTEAQQQLFGAQQEYLRAMLDLLNAKTDLRILLDTRKYEEN